MRSVLAFSNDRQYRMAALWTTECDIIAKGIARDMLTVGANALEVCDCSHFVSIPRFT
jgi:hypothetical protein